MARLAADDRRRQLLGIGLSKLVETPIHDLSLDEVAAEAGISRGLLFHYFPTKKDFYLACVSAAGRRILRNTAPDPGLSPDEQLREMVRLTIEQIDRRRAFYMSLVRGTGGGDVRVVEVYAEMREELTNRVLVSQELDPDARNVVHAWWAYVEDHAIEWSGQRAAGRTSGGRTQTLDDLTEHCVAALHTLLSLSRELAPVEPGVSAD